MSTVYKLLTTLATKDGIKTKELFITVAGGAEPGYFATQEMIELLADLEFHGYVKLTNKKIFLTELGKKRAAESERFLEAGL